MTLKEKIIDGTETTKGVTYIRHAHIYLAVKELKNKITQEYTNEHFTFIHHKWKKEDLHNLIDEVFG